MPKDNPQRGQPYTAEQALNALAIVNEGESLLSEMRILLLNKVQEMHSDLGPWVANSDSTLAAKLLAFRDMLSEAHAAYNATMHVMMAQVAKALTAAKAEQPATSEERPSRLH